MNWDLTAIYKDEKVWEKDYQKCERLLNELEEYKGKLDSFETFENFIIKRESLEITLFELYPYAKMSYDLNMKDQEKEARLQKIQLLLSKASEKLSWVDPEILSIGEEKIFSYVNKSTKLKEYKYPFESLFHQQKHILDKEQEQLLSYFSLFCGTPSNIYNALSIADAKPQKVKLNNGEEIEISSQNHASFLLKLEKQEDRKKVFEALYGTLENNKATYANIYGAIVKKNIAIMKARKYDSFLNLFLDSEKIPIEVYTNFIKVTKEGTKALKRYILLRKKILGLKEYYAFDRFVPLVKVDRKYSYEEAKNVILEAIKRTPIDYQQKVKEVMQDGYIDVKSNPNKCNGAYAFGTYLSHPYILLNFEETLNDVETLAHEAGHAVHTLYAMENQPYATYGYSIFVAEVASTFLERIVLDYLIEKSTDRNEKIYLLQTMIDRLVATFYRQTMFADYEYQAHSVFLKGEAITEKALSDIFIKLYEEYYDLDLKKDYLKRLVWAYVSHFFVSPFYVYKYATCYVISSKLYNDYKKEGDNAFDNFVNLLKAGGNDFPYNQVLKYGIDLTKKETIKPIIEDMEKLVDKLEKLLEEK
jgi:oligoendopeptidase F